MNKVACVVLTAAPLFAQAQFRTTRHAAMPFVLGDGRYIAGDVDSDGDLDLVAGTARRPHRLLLGDGRGAFTTASLSQLLAPASAWPQSADLADIDGDGDLDLLVGNDFALLGRVHTNNGAGVFTDVTAAALPPTVGFVQNQVIADFDGDGDVDWLTVEDSGCRFYRNNGSGQFADASAVALNGVPVVYGIPWELTAPAADIDNDGDLDAMIPTGLGPQLLLVNQGGVLRPHANQPPGPLSDCQFADADGDGDFDLVSRGNGRLL
ncbi:MAG: VCBS repeat-containing protein, partial [Planctomycetes bacterium]|nr:VCBS repeat-containing protein [Planctomycetota bacterium]